MAHSRKLNKKHMLMAIDATISIVSVIISYALIGTVGAKPSGLMVAMTMLYLPICVVYAMTLVKGYRTALKKTDIYDFLRYAKGLLVGIVMYISIDLVMRYNLMIVCKLFSIILAFVGMMLARVIYYSMNAQSALAMNALSISAGEDMEISNLAEHEVTSKEEHSIGARNRVSKKEARIQKLAMAESRKDMKKLNKSRARQNDTHNRPVDIEMLFTDNAYKQVILDDEAASYMRDKTVLITGAAGTIGSNLYKKMIELGVRCAIGIDIYENSLYELQRSAEKDEHDTITIYEIASIRDNKKMDEIFAKYRPDIVYHAAAHKHVPLMEKTPEEAVKNNVLGTYNCAKLADMYNVSKFIYISTDKAHNPVSVMGATKRIGEMVMQYMAGKSRATKYITLRFCNIIASNASVVPLMCKEIEAGGPVSVTDRRAFRYFISKTDAIDYIVNMTGMVNQSDIFVLDVEKPTSIKELAHRLIEAYGYKPNTDIKIKHTGMRPGERLYEELVPHGALPYKENVYLIGQDKFNGRNFHKKLDILKAATKENDRDNIRKIMAEIVTDYTYKLDKKGYNTEYDMINTKEELDREEAIV